MVSRACVLPGMQPNHQVPRSLFHALCRRNAMVPAKGIDMPIVIGQFYPRGKGAMRLTPWEAPNHKTSPNHNTGN